MVHVCIACTHCHGPCCGLKGILRRTGCGMAHANQAGVPDEVQTSFFSLAGDLKSSGLEKYS